MRERVERRGPVARGVKPYRQVKMSRRECVRHAAALGFSASSAASLLAAAAPTPAAAQAEPKTGGELTVGYDRELTRLDPLTVHWADPGFALVHDYTLDRDAGGGVVPGVVASWVIAEDGLTWTLTIRDGLTFHSGAPCTNVEVAANLDAFRRSGPGSRAPGLWSAVTDVRPGPGNTVAVSLAHPCAALAETLTTELAMLVNLATRADAGDDYGIETVDGAGPFRLTEFSPGDGAVFSRWAGYPGSGSPFIANPGPAYLDAVRIIPILDPASRARSLESGAVDAVINPSPWDLDRLLANPELVVSEWTALGNHAIALNWARAELGFDDTRVRRAVSHAIDRQALADSIHFGHGVATAGPIPAGWRWYEPDVERFNRYDPELARALLAEAGFTGEPVVRRDGVALSFELITEAAQTRTVAIDEAIIAMLADVGVEMRVTPLEPEEFQARLRDARQPVAAFSTEWRWSVPIDMLAMLAARPSAAFHGDLPELWDALRAWRSAADEAELEAAARRIQLVWAEQLPLVPVVTGSTIWAHHRSVRGWMPAPRRLFPPPHDLWLE